MIDKTSVPPRVETNLLPGHGLGIHDVLLDLFASLDHGLPQHSPQGGFTGATGAHHHHPHALTQLFVQLQGLLHLRKGKDFTMLSP